jgi:hypothetical protein
MAHDIGEMFYYGSVPWHGLGRYVPQPLDLDDALAQGGLDWTVRRVRIATAGGASSPAPHRTFSKMRCNLARNASCSSGDGWPCARPMRYPPDASETLGVELDSMITCE